MGELNIQNTLTALGNYSYDVFFNLVNALIDAKEADVLKIIAQFYNEGNDLKLFVEQFLTFCLNVCKYALFNSCELITIPISMEDKLKGCTNFDSPGLYTLWINY